MSDDELVVAELEGISIVSVLRVDGAGLPAATHVYELHSDGVVLGTFPTLRDVFSYLHTGGF